MKVYFNILTVLISFCSMQAQTDHVYTGTPLSATVVTKKNLLDKTWIKKVSYEGNVRFQWNGYTYLYLSPTIGYTPVKGLNVGFGGIYNYVSFNYGVNYTKVSHSVFGAHTYARYFIKEGVFIQGQYDKLFQPNVLAYGAEKKKWVDYVLLGLGFRKPVGDKIGLSGTLLYNLTPSQLSIYPGRLILQFGFMGSF